MKSTLSTVLGLVILLLWSVSGLYAQDMKLEKVIKVTGRERDQNVSKKVVVITDGDEQLGIVVDSLVGEDEIVIKSLTEHFSGVKGITGASILGDGRISLILDPFSIMREAK